MDRWKQHAKTFALSKGRNRGVHKFSTCRFRWNMRKPSQRTCWLSFLWGNALQISARSAIKKLGSMIHLFPFAMVLLMEVKGSSQVHQRGQMGSCVSGYRYRLILAHHFLSLRAKSGAYTKFMGPWFCFGWRSFQDFTILKFAYKLCRCLYV